jgi:prostaglandin-endoperoxide synthase 2
MDPRPYPLTTMDDFTSWDSLTDPTCSARELPRSAARAGQPPAERVLELFERERFVPSTKSTVLFAYVAQWFTDGFMRTPRLNADGDPIERDLKRNDSTHQVDLAQVYGPDAEMTERLRDGHRLACQTIDGEQYPPALFENGVRAKAFETLPTIGAKDTPRPDEFLAMASDAANTQIGYAALNTLFLRAHNAIADQIAEEHGELSPRQVFQATRSVLIVLTIKLVIEQYINHITPWRFRFRFDPGGFETARWHRPNRMAVEFNLLYRWHCLIPDTLRIHGEDLPVEKTAFRTRTLLTTGAGLGGLLHEASNQPAGAIELFNTGEFLRKHAERPTIEAARKVGVATYNDYRVHCGFERVGSFEQLSSDARVIAALEAVYKKVDNVEFYPGIYAEDRPSGSVVGPLMGRLVAVHAFSQLLTNPLLAPAVFNERTFTPTGMRIIDAVTSIQDVVDLVGIKGCDARLTHKTWTL